MMANDGKGMENGIAGISGIGTKMTGEKIHAKHGMMSLSEITENLYEEFPDEMEDANHYMDMSKSAYDMGHQELAYYLCEIAKDEFTHAKFIHHHLKESGVEISTEWHKEWEELENRFRQYFE